ncbi:GAF domain-containing protein [Paenibacillus periandrae]|uniref:GAF domain-containing protein n=1 Tax=Paenibacillus periandrae TaxID=1761741 RepID=UPI001F095AB4|nr:GAF domain-containing protein [Paenibacillus periandrae]
MDLGDANHTFYRFEGLLLAIEFFTQRFHLNQLSEFSFEFVNEILTLNASALFIRDGERFVMKQKRLYADKEYFIPYTGKLRRLVTFHGRTVRTDFTAFFEQREVDHFQMKWAMPLMIDDELHGFIVSNGKIMGQFADEDIVMSDTLMRLINNSMENSQHFADLQQSNRKLDQKIFNLFAIHHSTKALLSEVTLHRLHEIATDVFSEVSSSQITSFGVVDPITGRLRITGYRNVSSYETYHGDFELHTQAYNGPIVLHVERDQERIQALFVSGERLRELEAEYIILIVKDHIIGMVTLSRPVNDRVYDESTFELIESLATSTFIAISNAMLFQEVHQQRESAENKLKLLTTLNRLIRNLNECTTSEELCYFTLKTLQVSFGVRKALICLRSGDQYVVADAIGWEVDHKGRAVMALPFPESLEACMEGETLSDYMADGAARFFSKEVLQWMGSGNCAVLAPLTVGNRLVLAEDPYPKGLLVVLEAASSLTEEEVLLIDTVAKSIAPVLHQMNVTQSVVKQHKRDQRQVFVQSLQQHIESWQQYQIPFFLYYQVCKMPPFADMLQIDQAADGWNQSNQDEVGQTIFSFDGHRFRISNKPIELPGWLSIPNPYNLQAVLSFDYPA